MYNIAHVKSTKSWNFLLKKNNYSLKSYIFNAQVSYKLTILNFLTCVSLHMIEKF